MKKIIVSSLVSLSIVAFIGCASTSPTSIALNPLAGTNSPSFDPGLIIEAASQCPQLGSLSVVGPGVNFSWYRNAPPGYVAQPITPVTADRAAKIQNNFFASQVYAMRYNYASDDVMFTGFGLIVSMHLAYPPSSLNTNVLVPPTVITNVVVIPPVTNAVVIPSTTNSTTYTIQHAYLK